MNWNNVWMVARREFWVTVRQKGYLILTFGMPVFILLYIGLILIPQYFIAKKEAERRFVGVVDQSGVLEGVVLDNADGDLPQEVEKMAKLMGGKNLNEARKNLKLEITRFATPEEAQRAMDSKDVNSYFVIPPDYLETGKVLAYTGDGSVFSSAGGRSSFLRKALVDSLLKRAAIEPALMARIQNPMDLQEFTVSKKAGKQERDKIQELIRFAVPFGFGVLLMMSILMGATFLIHGVSEEKENRIMEVMLSSVSANAFFWGKLLGLGSAGFLQILVWLLLGAVPIAAVAAVLNISAGLILIALMYYVLGFFLFGALILGSSSLGTNLKEAQQMSMIWTLTASIGLIFIMPIVDDPHSVLACVLSYVPLLTPTVMVARTALDAAAWWEHLLAVALLVGSIFAANKFASKLFRLGMLSYGKQPTMAEIWRWLREPA